MRHRIQSSWPTSHASQSPRGCTTKRIVLVLSFAILGAVLLAGCSGGSNSGGPAPSGTDREQVEALIREFSARTTALDADGAIGLLCRSLREKSDLRQIRQNMEGFRNIGAAAPQISDLQFASITTSGNEGEARYSYSQRFRGETTTIQEGVKVAKENGRWCIKDQLIPSN